MKKIALVTGSSRGIGKAIALRLALDGHRVVINYYNKGANEESDRNRQEAQEVLTQMKSLGGDGIIIGADVSDSQAAQSLIDKTVEEYGQLDFLINNAGINQDQLLIRISDNDWNRIIQTDLNAAFYCCRAAVKHMIRKRFGRIINMSSIVGITGNAGQVHYSAAKAGVLGLTYSIAREYGNRGINANAVAPGYIQTDMTAKLNQEQVSKILSGVAVGRMGTPEDIAGVVSFLVSPQADYISGQVIRVDGGMAAM